jgi:hypothetical protein
VANHGTRHIQTGAPCRAVVVNVVYWDRRQAELVEDSLAAGGIAITIASDTLVDFVVRDMSIKHGFDASFEADFGIVDLPAGLDELRHAHAKDIRWRGFADHDGGCLRLKRGGFLKEASQQMVLRPFIDRNSLTEAAGCSAIPEPAGLLPRSILLLLGAWINLPYGWVSPKRQPFRAVGPFLLSPNVAFL